MKRVIDPLEMMGARIEPCGHRRDGLPLTIHGGRNLRGIDYALPVASAQVKTAILLSGLHAEGETRVREPLQSRNHTEIALQRFGAPVRLEDESTIVAGGAPLEPVNLRIPGDISSAAFFIVGAAIMPGSELRVEDVGLNPTRIGFIRVLQSMGADVVVEEENTAQGQERLGTVRVRGSDLHGIEIPADLVPNLIDEIPALGVAAARAEGETILRGASELRHKESNRLDAIINGLREMGADVEPLPDGLSIRGGRPLRAANLNSNGDHRMAMAWAVASLVAEGECEIAERKCVSVSYPGFWSDVERLAS
jgi:3-phosphoshikimate 1-carboxyvinyltransferase